jgi:hypothetical protein
LNRGYTGSGIWNGDAVIFYIGLYDRAEISDAHTSYQTGSESDFQMGLSLTGHTCIWRWQLGMTDVQIPQGRLKTCTRNGGWDFELQIPFSGLVPWTVAQFRPEAEMRLPFNIAIADDDDGGGIDSQLFWSNSAASINSYYQPNVWEKELIIDYPEQTHLPDIPVISRLEAQKQTLFPGESITFSALIYCIDEIDRCFCIVRPMDLNQADTLEMNPAGAYHFEGEWSVPWSFQVQTNVTVDIQAVDAEGDSVILTDGAFFQVMGSLPLVETSFSLQSYDIYRDSSIADIYIDMDQQEMDSLFAHGKEGSNIYRHASLAFLNDRIPETRFTDVGFRLRGAIPRYCHKRDFQIRFDAFKDGNTFYGIREMNLRGLARDPGIIREKLSLDLFWEMEVPSPRSSYVRLFINGEYRGIYLNVEEVDKNFLNIHFGNNRGNLYRCARDADLIVRPDGNYKYTYAPFGFAPFQTNRVYELQTNTVEDDYSDLIHFIEVINLTPDSDFKEEIEKILNVQGFLRALAVCVCIADVDGFWPWKNNYYLYHNVWTGRFEYLPRDFDLTFGLDWGGGSEPTRDIYSFGPVNSSRPLVQRIFNIPEYRQQCSDCIHRMIEGPFELDRIWPRIEWIRTLIRPAVEADFFRPLDYGWTILEFDRSFNEALGTYGTLNFLGNETIHTRICSGLKSFVEERISSARTQLDPMVFAHIRHVFAASDHPGRNETVTVICETSPDPAPSVLLHYNDGNGFQAVKMYDDGQHGDDLPDDHLFGAIIQPDTNARKISYYAAIHDESGRVLETNPENAPSILQFISFAYEKPALMINEFMADNKFGIQDEKGQHEDWIELYNAGPTPISCKGIYLTDDFIQAKLWPLPDITLDQAEFLLIFTDGDTDQGVMHADFKLNSRGEQIGLYDARSEAGNWIDQIIFPDQNPDVSFGRKVDGSTQWCYQTEPTPDSPNHFSGANTAGLPEHPLTFRLYPNFPNPFNNCTRIRFSLPRQARVILRIFDLVGREVARKENGFLNPGDHTIGWNATEFSTGIYFFTLSAGNSRLVSKMVLVR